MNRKKLTLYFDMDGVLADFDKALQSDISRMYKKGFFENLEVIGTPNKVIELLQNLGYNVYILSTGIRNKYCEIEKRNWLKKHCPSIKEENIIICKTGDKKTDFIKTNIDNSVLIDDYKENLINWQSLGGIAIKFGNKYKPHRSYLQIVNDIFHVVAIVESLNNAIAI
jgi:5'(3')-deoxyribonucleotidase